jgi:hypothetical protein
MLPRNRWSRIENVKAILLYVLACATLALPGPVSADADGSVPERDEGAMLPSVNVHFESAEAAARMQYEPEVLSRPSMSLSDEFAPGQTPGKQSWWPLLYSAIVPGTGELAMGYEKRGVFLMALEVAAWAGYFYNHEEGLNKRADYESFADENWDQQRWADLHFDVYPTFTGFTPEQMDSVGQVKSGNGAWPGYSPWVSKEEDRQHYYENIGKYDWYVSGWAGYDPDLPSMNTELRDSYRAMRKESNDQLDTANQFIYLSLATRVFSLIETSVLIVKARKAYGQEHASLDNRWMFRAKPQGMSGGQVYMEYRFK